MRVLRPVISYADEYDSDEGESDLEGGRRRRSLTGRGAMLRYLSRKIHRNFKPDAARLLGILLLLGSIMLLMVFLGENGGMLLPYSRSPAMQYHPYAGLTSLVMVAGHAVYTSRTCAKANDESSWFLEPYQRNSGQAATFLEHIHRGVEAAARDNRSLLLFSGGETRKEAGPRSEAQSYWSVADANDWFGHSSSVRDRAVTEEHARDSFENLLFSICRFRELTGQYPRNITVVSYHFKQHRFVGLHRAALNFPRERFAYIGTLPAISTAAAAARGELLVQEQFRKDPYGCIGQLREKRIRRDPFARLIPYPTGCPEIADLFTYCGSSVMSRRLPWN